MPRAAIFLIAVAIFLNIVFLLIIASSHPSMASWHPIPTIAIPICNIPTGNTTSQQPVVCPACDCPELTCPAYECPKSSCPAVENDPILPRCNCKHARGTHTKQNTRPCPLKPTFKFYSEHGQDRIMFAEFFEHFNHPRCYGTFLDVGAFDGREMSNSLFFEESLGWSGVRETGPSLLFLLPFTYECRSVWRVARRCLHSSRRTVQSAPISIVP